MLSKNLERNITPWPPFSCLGFGPLLTFWVKKNKLHLPITKKIAPCTIFLLSFYAKRVCQLFQCEPFSFNQWLIINYWMHQSSSQQSSVHFVKIVDNAGPKNHQLWSQTLERHAETNRSISEPSVTLNSYTSLNWTQPAISSLNLLTCFHHLWSEIVKSTCHLLINYLLYCCLNFPLIFFVVY